jgi:ribonuclease P/MRP protein subunit RPP40
LTDSLSPLTIADKQGVIKLNAVSTVRDLGISVSADFKPAAQCLRAAKTARRELFRLRNVVSCRRPEVFLPLYTAIVRPHLEYCVQSWSPYFSKDIECLEKVQRLATKMMAGLRNMPYEDRLKSLGLFSLRRRRARGDLIETFKILKGITKGDVRHLFELAPNRGTRGHNLKLRKTHAHLTGRANFFSNRVINMWNKLPMEVVCCERVVAFKHSLDKCWGVLFPDLN